MVETDVEVGTIVFQKADVLLGRKIATVNSAFEILRGEVIQGKILVVRCMRAREMNDWGSVGTKGEVNLDKFLTSDEFKKACGED